MPVFIVTPDGIIENMNHAASKIYNANSVPGSKYYTEKKENLLFTEEFPWFADSYTDFIKSKEQKFTSERFLDIQKQYFHISFSRSLDISGKFSGTIIIIEDITMRKNMEKELEKLAATDPLTGAKNRRSFLRSFEQELVRSHRYNHKLALLLMDLDHFKVVNDTYGHDTGDKVLKLLVAEAHAILRGADIFGRWGGDEFMVLLPDSDIHQASIVAERLRGNLSKLEITTDNNELIKFTVTIGMTVVENKDESLENIITKADKALYSAKNQGRNRVCIL